MAGASGDLPALHTCGGYAQVIPLAEAALSRVLGPAVGALVRTGAVGSSSRRRLTVSALAFALLLAGLYAGMPANAGIAAAETSLTPVIRDCGDHYLVTRSNTDGTTLGAWKKQLSEQGTIFTAGETWTLGEGGDGEPDRFVSGSGKVQQVVPCDEPQPNTLVSNTGQPSTTGASLIRNQAQAQAQFPCGNTPRPHLTIDEAVRGQTYFCDSGRQWVKRQLAIPGVDYASDAQIEAARNSRGARACRNKGFNTWDPITEGCLTRAPWY